MAAEYNHLVNGVYDDGDDIGFLYTQGLHPARKEIIVREVPRAQAPKVVSMINFLSTRTLLEGQTAATDESRQMIFMILEPTRKQQRELLKVFMCRCDRGAKVLELFPITAWPA